jgi:nitric oxide synthase oxygenase domain/subunit
VGLLYNDFVHKSNQFNLFIFRESKFDERWEEVSESIESNGFYDLSLDEISFGARTAWRNVARSQ